MSIRKRLTIQLFTLFFRITIFDINKITFIYFMITLFLFVLFYWYLISRCKEWERKTKPTLVTLMKRPDCIIKRYLINILKSENEKQNPH